MWCIQTPLNFKGLRKSFSTVDKTKMHHMTQALNVSNVHGHYKLLPTRKAVKHSISHPAQKQTQLSLTSIWHPVGDTSLSTDLKVALHKCLQ
jgi:hypothetical protein